MNALTETQTPIVITQYEAIKNDIIILEQADKAASFDYRNPKENKLARSHVYSMRQIKGKIEGARKEAKAYALEYGRKVDTAAKDLSSTVDGLIAPHQEAIDVIENEEKQRVGDHRSKIDQIMAAKDCADMDAEAIKTRLGKLKDYSTEGFEEFKGQADAALLDVLKSVEGSLEKQVTVEAEAAELDRLRKEAAEREEADRIAKIRQEAIDAERKRAEEERVNKAVEAKAAQDRKEREAKENEERKEREAKAAIEAAEKRELEAKLASERAEREKEEQRRRAEAAEAQSKAESERREREQAEATAHKEIAEKAAKDNKDAVMASIIKDLESVCDCAAVNVAKAIAGGKIRHLRIDWSNA